MAGTMIRTTRAGVWSTSAWTPATSVAVCDEIHDTAEVAAPGPRPRTSSAWKSSCCWVRSLAQNWRRGGRAPATGGQVRRQVRRHRRVVGGRDVGVGVAGDVGAPERLDAPLDPVLDR